MSIFLDCVTFLAGGSLLLSLLNFFTVRQVKESTSTIDESVAILIPMRDEEFNVDGVISSALASTGLKELRVVALNDSSTDKTAELLDKYQSEITVLQGADLPEGWLGKPFACQQLADASAAHFLVFIDADVRLTPGAVSASLALMNKHGWDFLSPYPAQRGRTFFMKLIQPLLQWSWLTSVPLRLAESGRINSMIVANGQFLIVKRSAYQAIGGHHCVKGEVLEDLSLARALNARGFKGSVADASSVATCTMYESNSALVDGYTKSLWKAFGGAIGCAFAVSLLFATQVAPIVLVVMGYSLAIIPFAAVALTHLLSAIRTRSPRLNVLTHPIAVIALIALIGESWRRKSRGQLQWRGRRVS